MDDGLSVAKIVCASIIFSFFHIAPLVHSIINRSAWKKSKALSNPDELLGNIEQHMSEAEIEHEFNSSKCCSCLRIFSVYSHIGIVAVLGLHLFIHDGSIDFWNYTNTYLLIIDFFCINSWVFFAIIIILEILCSYELRELKKTWIENFTQYLNDLVRTPPKIFMKCEIYHYVGTGGINGDTRKVIDLVFERQFKFSRWLDTSPSPQSLPLWNNKQKIRVRLSKKIKFGDEATENEYNKQWADFKAEAMANKESKFPGSSIFFDRIESIEGFKSSFFTFLDPDSWTVRPRWFKRRYFLLASLFGLTWFYRLAFKRSTQKTAFRITKTIFLR
jgi:hypothetical protein